MDHEINHNGAGQVLPHARSEGYNMAKDSAYPDPHHVVVTYKDRDSGTGRQVQQIRCLVIDGHPLCLPMGGELRIEPNVGGVGTIVTVALCADSVLFEPNAEL